jgi:hypothetical protein
MGIPFGTGLQMLFDASQQFTRAGLPVYLRVRNFQDTGTYLEVGVPFSPSGAAAFETGTTDILIMPPPSVVDVSLHNIGLMAGRLNFGSRIFIVSNTFVQAQMNDLGITDPYAVWRDRDGKYKAVGIIYQSRQFSIESITQKVVAGQTINWKLICNALETVADALQPGE